MLCTHLFIFLVSEHFYIFIIYPPDRCGISRSRSNSMIITQVHLVLGTRQCHSKMCSSLPTQCHKCLKLRERAIGMLTAGMSTRAVARKSNGNFSIISRLQRRFIEFVRRCVGKRFANVNIAAPW